MRPVQTQPEAMPASVTHHQHSHGTGRGPPKTDLEVYPLTAGGFNWIIDGVNNFCMW